MRIKCCSRSEIVLWLLLLRLLKTFLFDTHACFFLFDVFFKTVAMVLLDLTVDDAVRELAKRDD